MNQSGSSPRTVVLACIVGARPNFMKIAPLLRALSKYPHVQPVLIHTGQHYDPALSDVFFEELGIPRPDLCLNVGSGSQAVQTARILERMEEALLARSPQGLPYTRVVVVGDVNSTMAASLAAAKLQIPIAHVEAGLRSRDRSMPEEINRMVTDTLSDMLFVSEPVGVENLLSEGHPREQIHLMGNVMIDTLQEMLPRARKSPILETLGLQAGKFAFATLHRPSNVDDPVALRGLIEALLRCSRKIPIVFPMHPRTRSRLGEAGLEELIESRPELRIIAPLGYIDCLALTSQARLIITDSGGLQEESTALGVPCLTMRTTTERPISVSEGTSTLVGSDLALLERLVDDILQHRYRQGQCPTLWDGQASERIAAILASESAAQ